MLWCAWQSALSWTWLSVPPQMAHCSSTLSLRAGGTLSCTQCICSSREACVHLKLLEPTHLQATHAPLLLSFTSLLHSADSDFCVRVYTLGLRHGLFPLHALLVSSCFWLFLSLLSVKRYCCFTRAGGQADCSFYAPCEYVLVASADCAHAFQKAASPLSDIANKCSSCKSLLPHAVQL